jgi:hypothetical protein
VWSSACCTVTLLLNLLQHEVPLAVQLEDSWTGTVARKRRCFGTVKGQQFLQATRPGNSFRDLASAISGEHVVSAAAKAAGLSETHREDGPLLSCADAHAPGAAKHLLARGVAHLRQARETHHLSTAAIGRQQQCIVARNVGSGCL